MSEKESAREGIVTAKSQNLNLRSFRLLQNRQSAALSRQRKKEFLSNLERRSSEYESENKLMKQQLSIHEQRYHDLEQKYTILLKQNEELKFILKTSDKSEELNRILAQTYTAYIQASGLGVDRNVVLIDQKLPVVDHSFVQHVSPPQQPLQLPVVDTGSPGSQGMKTNNSPNTPRTPLVFHNRQQSLTTQPAQRGLTHPDASQTLTQQEQQEQLAQQQQHALQQDQLHTDPTSILHQHEQTLHEQQQQQQQALLQGHLQLAQQQDATSGYDDHPQLPVLPLSSSSGGNNNNNNNV